MERSQQESEGESKRKAGILTEDGRWLVLTESLGEEGVIYKHNCGSEILGKSLAFSIRDGVSSLSGSGEVRNITVPFCSNCEKEPSFGEITPEGKLIVFW